MDMDDFGTNDGLSDYDSSNDEDVVNNNQNDSNSDSDTETNNKDILKQIDKKLVIKYMKEIKTSRTYIYGLYNYIKTKEETKEFIKKIKKALGTSVFEKMDDDNNMIYGFAGDHTKYIYDYIVKNNITPISEIKK
jgi:hypothetical protein